MTEGTSIVNTKEYLKLLDLEQKWRDNLIVTDFVNLTVALKFDSAYEKIVTISSFLNIKELKEYFRSIEEIRKEYTDKAVKDYDDISRTRSILTMDKHRLKQMSIFQFLKWRKEK